MDPDPICGSTDATVPVEATAEIPESPAKAAVLKGPSAVTTSTATSATAMQLGTTAGSAVESTPIAESPPDTSRGDLVCTIIDSNEGVSTSGRPEVRPWREGIQVSPSTWTSFDRKTKRRLLRKAKRATARQTEAAERSRQEETRKNDPEYQAQLKQEEEAAAKQAEQDATQHAAALQKWLEAEEDAQRKHELQQAQQQQRPRPLARQDTGGRGGAAGHQKPAPRGPLLLRRDRKKQKKARQAAAAAAPKPPPPSAADEAARVGALTEAMARSAAELEEAERALSRPELDALYCPFFRKMGACQYGPRCRRKHVYPLESTTLLLPNMFSCPALPPVLADDADALLDMDDRAAVAAFEEFYDDVHAEFSLFGPLFNFKVCCNAAPHLRGNVYVQYRSLADALQAFAGCYGRFYAGAVLQPAFVRVVSWREALCGPFAKGGRCPRGAMCNFLHCFQSPRCGPAYRWGDRDLLPPQPARRRASTPPEEGADEARARESAGGGRRRHEYRRLRSSRSRERADQGDGPEADKWRRIDFGDETREEHVVGVSSGLYRRRFQATRDDRDRSRGSRKESDRSDRGRDAGDEPWDRTGANRREARERSREGAGSTKEEWARCEGSERWEGGPRAERGRDSREELEGRESRKNRERERRGSERGEGRHKRSREARDGDRGLTDDGYEMGKSAVDAREARSSKRRHTSGREEDLDAQRHQVDSRDRGDAFADRWVMAGGEDGCADDDDDD